MALLGCSAVASVVVRAGHPIPGRGVGVVVMYGNPAGGCLSGAMLDPTPHLNEAQVSAGHGMRHTSTYCADAAELRFSASHVADTLPTHSSSTRNVSEA